MMNKGFMHIYTGDGKGKTTAAVGLAVRASGAGKKVLFSQLMKGRPTSELEAMEQLGIYVLRCKSVEKFVFNMNEQELEKCRLEHEKIFNKILAALATDEYDMIVIDEAISAVTTKIIDLDRLLQSILTRTPKIELVLTGRNPPQQLIEIADYISVIDCMKHPFKQGIAARLGIEF